MSRRYVELCVHIKKKVDIIRKIIHQSIRLMCETQPKMYIHYVNVILLHIHMYKLINLYVSL